MSPTVPGSDRPGARRPLWRALLGLARPTQWAKSAFVLIGPAYNVFEPVPGRPPIHWPTFLMSVGAAVGAFCLASSGCYIFNDIRDCEADRAHPRKCRRPIASGEVPVGVARNAAIGLVLLAAALLLLVPVPARWWLGAAVGVYVLNVAAYSVWFKHIVILDVISLAGGFVLRVLGGCAAASVAPSPWLLNCSFFIAMFLAFGKRLGERRMFKGVASDTRAVHGVYTDDLLRMVVVVTAVATLVTYAAYVQGRGEEYTRGFNVLWLTMLPATYAVLRCMVLLELGDYDDPTELAIGDRPFQVASVLFGVITIAVAMYAHQGRLG